MIRRKEEFLAYIDRLPIKESTNHTYRNWVRRIDEHCPVDLSPHEVRSEADVIRIADTFPKDKFVRGHIKDIRCLVRYYLKFLLHDGILKEQESAEAEGTFDPKTPEDARERVSRSIALRRGQRKFGETLLRAYNRKCALTDTSIEDILEAAHIKPYATSGSNRPANGLLLRADIHTLFDLCLISINPRTLKAYCAPSIRSSADYAKLHGKSISLPKDAALRPDPKFLSEHYEQSIG